MLDRAKIIKEIDKATGSLFSYDNTQIDLAFAKWQEIVSTPNFNKRVNDSKSSFLLPAWQQNLDQNKLVNLSDSKQYYALLAVDGSQIYPERHVSGINCFLINIGQILLEYGEKSSATFYSDPKIFTPDQAAPAGQSGDKFSPDLVDLKREELELNESLNKASILAENYKNKNMPFLVFVDGTLIFWTLEGKPQDIKKYFLNEYLKALDGFYKLNIPIAGYISMPKSRELVNLTKIGYCRFEHANCIRCHSVYKSFPCNAVSSVYDTQLCSRFLDKYWRTNIFYSNSKIIEHYPAHLKPCFFYLNVGQEIIRLELPTWVAESNKLVDQVCNIAIDQVIKGFGYPVALAQAHEMAVIKASDREFFYQIIYKKSFDLKQRIIMSPKKLKKRSS